MDRHLEIALIALVLILCSLRVVSAVEVPFTGIPKIDLTFDLAGQQPDWKLESQSRDQARYACQGHALVLKLEKKGSQQLLGFAIEALDGHKLSVKSYQAKVILPTAGLEAVMVPNTRILAHTLIYFHENKKWPENPQLRRCRIPESFEEAAQANSEAPFILICDNKGNNRVAVGWALGDVTSHLRGAAENGSYVLTLSRQNDQPFQGNKLQVTSTVTQEPVGGGRFEDALIINTSSKPWMEAEREYAKTFDAFNNRKHSKIPEWTSEPVFCTWYCYLDHIDQAGVLKIAKKCKDLGIGTILIDAGWDAKPDGGFGDFQNGVLGDFVAMPDRFPDFAKAVKQIHDMGLRVELWSAPFWQGKKSKTYQEKTKDWHCVTPDGESHNLCPKYPGTRELFREQFATVAKRYGIDGMWLDAADGVPAECQAKHEHLDQPMGEAFVDCLAAVRDGLRSVNPEAITEVRVLHGNLNSKRAIDIVQPSDAPESYEILRLAGIHLRPWAYDIVVKNDPMFWKKDADAATVGKFMATNVTNGIPTLSVDFLTASDEQCQITKAWLKFYKDHKKTLLKGDFSLFGADYSSPDMMLTGKGEAIVYIKNPKTREVIVPKSTQRVIVLNCTDSDKLNLRISLAEGRYRAQSYLPDWSEKGSIPPLDSDGKMVFSQTVPQGGAAVIEGS